MLSKVYTRHNTRKSLKIKGFDLTQLLVLCVTSRAEGYRKRWFFVELLIGFEAAPGTPLVLRPCCRCFADFAGATLVFGSWQVITSVMGISGQMESVHFDIMWLRNSVPWPTMTTDG